MSTDATGGIVALFLCTAHRAPMTLVAEAEFKANFGIAGDRHAVSGSRRQVVLIEAEILRALDLDLGEVRENVTTAGIALMALPRGTRLQLGESGATVEITGPCDPCYRMDEIRPGLQAALEGRRGVTARVVSGGTVRAGDRVAVAQRQSALI